MFSPTIQVAMNVQLNRELYASYLYLSMAAHCEANNMPGFAHWMMRQADEEREHAMKFYRFILDRGGRVALAAVDQPPTEFDSPLALFEQVLAHEQEVSQAINDLYGVAEREHDYPSLVLLQWFVSEQVEEEKVATQIVETLRTIDGDKLGLLMLDRELGVRKGTDPAAPIIPSS